MSIGGRRCPKCGGQDIKAVSVFMNGTGDYLCWACRHKWTTRAENVKEHYQYDD